MTTVVKNPPANAADISDVGSIPGLEDPLKKGMETLSSNSCLENSMDKGTWWATIHGVAKS